MYFWSELSKSRVKWKLCDVRNVSGSGMSVLLRELFLGTLAKLRKATMSFVMSVRPSVRLHATVRLPLDGFAWNLMLEYFFEKSVEKINDSLKSDQNNGKFT